MKEIDVDAVVIGAGLAGIYSAIKLRQSGKSVVLIDNAAEAGGLMRSFNYDSKQFGDLQFDMGTHYLLLTGDDSIDRVFTDKINSNEWEWFDQSLPEGHFSENGLDVYTGCLNITNNQNHAIYLTEFMQASGNKGEPETLLERWENDFGPAITREVLSGIARKFTTMSPENIAAEAIDIFCPYRLKLIDGIEATRLKESPFIDGRLAHSMRIHGHSDMKKGYPKSGNGIGILINRMLDDFEKSGGFLVLGAKELNIQKIDKNASSLKLESACGKLQVTFKHVVSALAPKALGFLFDVKIPDAPFMTMPVTLFHMVIDRAYKEQSLHWVTNYYSEHSNFRTTLYANITESSVPRITVEVIGEMTDVDYDLIMQELVEMNIVEPGSQALFKKTEYNARAYPVLLPGWKQNLYRQSSVLSDELENLIPIGPAAGTVFGQVNILKDCDEKLESLIA